AAIPRDLLESELFGHTKGAFTGAIKEKKGKFQLADGGTIFLDEVGELLLELQPKLLRALQEKEVEPIGATMAQKLDVRVVSATNLNIEQAIADGTFREDLYYRLSVIPLHLPPLRDRTEDIKLLLKYFCGKHCSDKIRIENDALEILMAYPWPGNVRELENTVERLIIMRNSDTIKLADVPIKFREYKVKTSGVVKLPDEGYSLEQLEREIVIAALERNAWNQTAAARFLKIPRHTLIYRIEKYDIKLPGKQIDPKN
ncbi:MAG: sigma 54-interacting transcriptional regulator, partial [Geobacteraceae bacterium]|nr:sigma 54-interacting transcriptional regulator [Geobacteraceae bacterium]